MHVRLVKPIELLIKSEQFVDQDCSELERQITVVRRGAYFGSHAITAEYPG